MDVTNMTFYSSKNFYRTKKKKSQINLDGDVESILYASKPLNKIIRN